MNEKTMQLINAGDEENIRLGLMILSREDPSLWAALLGYNGLFLSKNFGSSGTFSLNQNVIEYIKKNYISVGSRVRYKGLDNSPMMIITEIALSGGGFPAGPYHTKLTCKYFNKSNQGFQSIVDRLECFQIIEDGL